MSVDHDLWLADLVRAFRILRPADGPTRRRVATLLGVEPMVFRDQPPAPEPLVESHDEPVEDDLPPPDFQEDESPLEPVPAPGDVPRGIRLRQRTAGTEAAARTAWLPDAPTLSAPAEIRAGAAQEPDSLLDRIESRAIWGAALKTGVGQGDIDVERLVDLAGEGRPVVEVPRKAVPTLATGVHLLVDLAPAMGPFRMDWRRLLRDLEAVAGRGRVRTYFFRACPGRGVGERNPFRVKTYRIREPGVAVVTVTDLGLAPGGHEGLLATAEEWRDFLRDVKEQSGHPVVVTPYPEDRWPPVICAEAPVVHWDHTTSARVVQRVVREAEEGAG